jgi:hypothetical protein
MTHLYNSPRYSVWKKQKKENCVNLILNHILINNHNKEYEKLQNDILSPMG